MDRILINNMEFLKVEDDDINILISTATNNISYKTFTLDGEENLKKLKTIFKLDDVNYLKQTHSDIIKDLKGESIKANLEGDGLITCDKNIACGVFTADCVPVIIYDKKKGVIAAVHSGWKGTFYEISKKACTIMQKEYGCEDIKVIIGPHIKDCCYEVSEDLIEKFKNKFSSKVAKGRKLNLEQCIKEQLKGIVKEDDIKSLNLCTLCDKEIPLHSFRKDMEQAGRLFTFIYRK